MFVISLLDEIFGDSLRYMWTYLQRWQILNCIHHLQNKRNNILWIYEHDLSEYIIGHDIEKPETNLSKIRGIRNKLVYFFFKVNNHDDFYTKIRNIVMDCEKLEWVEKLKDGPFYRINLSYIGRSLYPHSHLIGIFFGNKYVEWITKALLTLLFGWIALHMFNINISPK